MNPLALWVVDPQNGMYGPPEQLWECGACGTIVRNRNQFKHPGFCLANPARKFG